MIFDEKLTEAQKLMQDLESAGKRLGELLGVQIQVSVFGSKIQPVIEKVKTKKPTKGPGGKKLSEEQVDDIGKRIQNGASYKVIKDEFNISLTTYYRIKKLYPPGNYSYRCTNCEHEFETNLSPLDAICPGCHSDSLVQLENK